MMDAVDDPLCTWGINLCWVSTFSSVLLVSVDILAISPCCFGENIQASLLEHTELSTTKATFHLISYQFLLLHYPDSMTALNS